ncbi:MAG: hypothetical protein ACI8X5_003457 [Planctomycetota bacterium]|jgi:hypothetical protein
MNIFCKLLGHTWIHEAEEQTVQWGNDKNLMELFPKAEAEPQFFRRCVRCKEQRPWKEA